MGGQDAAWRPEGGKEERYEIERKRHERTPLRFNRK